MDQVHTNTLTSKINTLLTLSQSLQVKPKTSATWSFDHKRFEESISNLKLVRNTIEDNMIAGDQYFTFLQNIFAKSNASRKITEFRITDLQFSNDSSSLENNSNARRINDLKQRFTSELLQALKQESVEPGVLGRADSIISNCLQINELATTNWLSDLFIHNFDRPTIAADILLLAGRLPYQTANPTLVTLAIGGLNHTNIAVQEAAIRAFENWAAPNSLKILENIQVHSEWLRDYLEDVKNDLKAIYSATR